MAKREAMSVAVRPLAIQHLVPGLVAAALVATAGYGVEQLTGWPGVVMALLIGMALNPFAPPALQPGLAFCIKKLLRIAIALLGVRIALGDIWALGPPIAAMVVVTMALTLIAGILAARAVGSSTAFGALAGGATAVCGASAALAIASVLPKEAGREADAAFVVLAVNALSTIAMVAYPWLCHWLGYDDRLTGIVLGATIHDVAQVVGSGYSVSPLAGDTAVIVKLFRVFLLLPVVLAIGFAFARSGETAGEAKVSVPFFAIAFVALAAANSLGLVPDVAKGILVGLSKAGLLLAIAALGLQTAIRAMIRLGWRPMAVVAAATLALLGMVIGAIETGLVHAL